jgi:hypothetical protein
VATAALAILSKQIRIEIAGKIDYSIDYLRGEELCFTEDSF